MKNWGWIMLLATGSIISALIVVLIIEKIKGLPIFNETDPNLTTTIVSKETVIDESIYTPPSTIHTPVINPPRTNNNQPLQVSNNLISNSSFELNPLTTKYNWQTSGVGKKHNVEWSTEHAATGQHALKISAAQPSNRGWPGWQTQLSHRENSGYELQAKYYTADGANAWLELSFLDNNNKLIKSFSTGCPRTSIKNQWTLVEHKVKAEWIPEGNHIVRIGLRQCLNHIKGRRTTLFFDDVSLHYSSD